MKKLSWFIQISRPRFWFYLFGPFLIGIAAGYTQLGDSLNNIPILVVCGLFFLIPANLLIYGVNDLFDYETDKNNPKKKAYESLIEPKNRSFFIKILSLATLPLVALMSYLFVSNQIYTAVWMLIGFIFFGVGYSMPPIRAKTKPFLDSLFNILYIFPGLVAYAILTNSWPSLAVIIAATAWCMAMHAFSAIPDIDSDKKANIKTIATILGKNKTILFCSTLYFIAAVLTYQYLTVFALIGGFTYLTTMLFAFLARSKEDVFAIYKLFPYINVLIGTALFFSVIIA